MIGPLPPASPAAFAIAFPGLTLKTEKTMIIRSSLFISLTFVLAAGAAHAQNSAQAEPAQAAPATVLPAPAEANPLVKIDNVVGTGREAGVGNTVVVNYTGWFYKPLAAKQRGRKFDSSLDAGREPLEFTLGAGKVIKGWDQGVVGMKEGGKRTLIIPSELAYGKRGAGGGSIPADSDLIFDVELLKVK
jgi:FKBP-type peptidyl-prolyl cis-trans isomerase FkpA